MESGNWKVCGGNEGEGWWRGGRRRGVGVRRMMASRVMASSSPSHTASDLARFAAGGGGGARGWGR